MRTRAPLTDRDREVFIAAYKMALLDAAQCADGVVDGLAPKPGKMVPAEEAYRAIVSTMKKFSGHIRQNASMLAELNVEDFAFGRRGGEMNLDGGVPH